MSLLKNPMSLTAARLLAACAFEVWIIDNDALQPLLIDLPNAQPISESLSAAAFYFNNTDMQGRPIRGYHDFPPPTYTYDDTADQIQAALILAL